jgi:hypothetical protein
MQYRISITEKQQLYMIMHTTRNMIIIVIAEKVENWAKKRATETSACHNIKTDWSERQAETEKQAESNYIRLEEI